MTDLYALSATDIVARVAAGTLSATEIVDACIARIEAVDPAVRAVVTPRFEEARREAAAADALRASGGPLGPLHGLPITVKDQLRLAGTPVTLGLRARKDLIDQQDGPLVARLRAAGAIVLGKTNVLQMLMGWECDNPLFGPTHNPWNLARTPGGSSGGEAAAVASGMSPLGIGADFGGSVRLPAFFCGVAGLKPTGGRLTSLDTPSEPFTPSQEAIIPQVGPIARNVADLRLAMSVLAPPGSEDPFVPPVPWRDGSSLAASDLRIGWFDGDGLLETSPALKRAVAEAASMLADAGAKVVPFEPIPGEEVIGHFLRLLTADRMQPLRRVLVGETVHPALEGNIQLASMSPMMRWLAGLLLRRTQPRIARLMAMEFPVSSDAYFAALYARRVLLMELIARMDRAGIDLLMGPPLAVPSFEHGASSDLLDAASPMVVYNVLGLPAGVIPTTTIREDEQAGRPDGGDPTEAAARKGDAGSAGLPVGVQLAGRPWREDQVLAAMALVEQLARTREDYPHTPVTPT